MARNTELQIRLYQFKKYYYIYQPSRKRVHGNALSLLLWSYSSNESSFAHLPIVRLSIVDIEN